MLDYYERHLRCLAMVYAEENGNGSVAVQLVSSGGVRATLLDAEHGVVTARWGDGVVPALTALLDHLGVPVPKRPSAEAVRSASLEFHHPNDARDLHAHDPLLASAVLAVRNG